MEKVEKESEMMNDLFLLMSEVKARAITSFKISPESLEGDYDQIQFNDANNASAGEIQNAEKGKQIESFLKENLSNLHYKEASEMLSDLTDGQVKFQSAHLIYAKAREKVKGYEIKNSEYKEDNEQTQSISTNLERDENGEITMKTNKKVPEFLFGASLPIDEAMNMIYHQIGLIVGQIPDASMEDALGESMLLGCADAAEMDSLPSKSKHVTSFSVVPSSIFLVERCAVYTSSIYHILPINQLNSKELLDHLKYILNDRFVDWISVKEKASFSIAFVDMHDAKFTYTMIQCSSWSRKYHPFATCACLRGQGRLSGHQCLKFTAQQYIELRRKSEDRMKSQMILAAVCQSGVYTQAHHRDWVDEYNMGVSHFGIPSPTWSIELLVWDVFHGRCNYVKLQVKYIRHLMEGNYESIDRFASFLTTTMSTWGAFEIKPWLNNETNSRLKGRNTKEFTRNTHTVCLELQELVNSSACENLCTALYAFEKINCFLTFVLIDNYETANSFLNTNEFNQETDKQTIGLQMISEFESLSEQLYKAGMKTYLSDRVEGDHETFYAHALRFYFPDILKKTYNKYGLGLGVYTMEGFESINYMTKRLIRNNSNRRGNICKQTMVRIVHKYMNHTHNVQKNLELRAKNKEKVIKRINQIHHFEEELSHEQNEQLIVVAT